MRLGNCLVDSLILADAAKEINFCFLRRSGRVIRVPRTDFQCNICSDDSRVVAYGFDEHDYYAPFASHSRFNESSNEISGQKPALL